MSFTVSFNIEFLFWRETSLSVSVSIRRRYHLLVLTRREREHLFILFIF